MNDSVREELETSLAPVSGQLRTELKRERPPVLAPPPKPVYLETRPQPAAASPRRVETAGFGSPKTNPTLVDFQAKNSTLPEWRLQVQNAVRQRMGMVAETGNSSNDAPAGGIHLPTRVATSIKSEAVQNRDAKPAVENSNPVLAGALQRIADSRKAFLPGEAVAARGSKPAAARNFPFNVVAPSPPLPARPVEPRPNRAERAKPAMVTPLRMEKRLDTNKLPRLATVVPEPIAIGQGMLPAEAKPGHSIIQIDPAHSEFAEINRIHITAEHHDDDVPEFAAIDDGIEDLAPFSVRFNAGLFDLMTGIFAAIAVLSPIALTGGPWLTTSGVLLFAGTGSLIMFLYLTISLGIFGKTIGMRLFQLELVDAEGNEPPSLKQASVSSSLYIISLALGGLGFVSVFFNEERRAVHDLLSGTIVVREF